MKINLDNGKYIKLRIKKNKKGTYEYYNGNILLGVYTPNVMKNSKFLEIDLERHNTLMNELSAESKDQIKHIIAQVKEQIEQTDVRDLEIEAKENEAIDGYARSIGMDKEKVKSTTIMDLEREKYKIDSEKEDKKDIKEKVGVNNFNTNTPKVTKKDVNIKQEVSLEEQANDVETFKKWIGGKLPSDIKKIGVIESDEMSKMKDDKGKIIDNPTTRLSLVAIGKDGRVEPLKKYIPQLEQNHSSGNNPTNSKYQIDTNGEVEKDAVLSEYRIGNKIIQLDKDTGDNLEVNIGQYSPSSNNLITTRMRDRNTTFKTDIETRKAVNGYYNKGIYASENSYKEAKMHEKNNPDCDKMNEKDIDGDMTTRSHTHVDDMIKQILENDAISDVYNYNDVKRHIEEKMKNSEELDENEIIEQVEEEMENSAEAEHEMPSSNRIN